MAGLTVHSEQMRGERWAHNDYIQSQFKDSDTMQIRVGLDAWQQYEGIRAS